MHHPTSGQHSRRTFLTGAGASLAAAAATPLLETTVNAQLAPTAPNPSARPAGRSDAEPFGYCLNMSTVRGQKLTLPQQVDLAAKAGYGAIEPWVPEVEEYVKQGGSLKDLATRIGDAGLTVESAIGFAEWIVDDEARRARGLEHAQRDMDLMAHIGGKRIAAPPIGMHDANSPPVDLLKAAERYRTLLELGEKIGVVPQVEVWGFSRNLHRLGQAALVAIEAGHKHACVLADVYHVYKGGSDFAGLKLMNGAAMHVLHVNDYPAVPPRAEINDSHRVYPGDGAAPLDDILRTLRDAGYRGFLSLELFNESYWKQDAMTVAKTGLEKTKAAVRQALA